MHFFRFCLFLSLGASATRLAAVKPPNILFLFTDDQAPWAVGKWKGHTHADTPNLDKLFSEGAYLPNTFVVTPVCSPSRASLATSRYGAELGITDWIHPRSEPKLGLEPKTTTWYEVLQRSGYHTALVGKWHLGLTDAHHPTKTGFDYFMGHRGGGWSSVNPTLEKDGKPQKFEGLNVDVLADHAIDYLENKRSEDKPFLLCLHFRAPHTRWLPVAEEDWAPFANLDPKLPHPDYPGLDTARVKRMTREYLASVRGVDRNVGRVLAVLDALGLRENTFVVYSSDHGYAMGHNGVWHKGNGHWVLTKDALPPATKNIPRGQRPNLWDHSLRVPTAIRWPGVVKPGTVIKHTISFLDWYPTLVALAGAKLPRDETIRGRNFLPILRGEKPAWEDGFFFQYSTKHQSRTHMRAWRTPEWKLVRDFLNPERDELYDLRADPDETNNLIRSKKPEHQAVVKKHHALILTKMKETNDPALLSAKNSK